MEMQKNAFTRVPILWCIHAHRDITPGLSRWYSRISSCGQIHRYWQWRLARLSHLSVFGYSDFVPPRTVGGDVFEERVDLLGLVSHVAGMKFGGIEDEVAGDEHFWTEFAVQVQGVSAVGSGVGGFCYV